MLILLKKYLTIWCAKSQIEVALPKSQFPFLKPTGFLSPSFLFLFADLYKAWIHSINDFDGLGVAYRKLIWGNSHNMAWSTTLKRAQAWTGWRISYHTVHAATFEFRGDCRESRSAQSRLVTQRPRMDLEIVRVGGTPACKQSIQSNR